LQLFAASALREGGAGPSAAAVAVAKDRKNFLFFLNASTNNL
jgi:hypothetical protein